MEEVKFAVPAEKQGEKEDKGRGATLEAEKKADCSEELELDES